MELWEFAGGGTLTGETTKQSAVRELKEETILQMIDKVHFQHLV